MYDCICSVLYDDCVAVSVGAAVADELHSLFVGDLNPIAPKAQRKVPVPEG